MDDLSSKLSEILGSEQGMAGLQNLANMLTNSSGGTNGSQNTSGGDLAAMLGSMLSSQNQTQNQSQNALPAPVQEPGAGNGIDMSALSGLLSNLTSQPTPAQPAPPENTGLPNIDINMIMGIQQALSAMRQDNPNTRMLRALRPLLRIETQQKLDKAIRMMQLFSVLPMLTKSGLFQNLLG